MKKYLVVVFALFLLFSTTSCDENSGLVVLKKKVKYEVTGTSNHYTIRYYDEDGDYLTTEVRDDWEYEYKGKANRYLYLSATNNEDFGEVRVKIYVNNKLLYSDDNELPGGIASVSGYL
jgi:hypothetical protein